MAETLRDVGAAPPYFSLDPEILDLTFAPGVADPESGVMTTLQLVGFMNTLREADNAAQIMTLTAYAVTLQLVTHIADYGARNTRLSRDAADV
ncbi:MAG: arginase family protein [Acetobacteraceae bacterium]